MKNYLLFLLPLFGISNTQTSCAPKGDVIMTNIAKEDLLGKWQWVLSRRESRMNGTTETTPEDLGKTMLVEFTVDDKVNVYHDGQLVTTNTYELSNPGTDNQTMLKVTVNGQYVEPNCESGPISLKGKTLTISGGYNDAGSTQVFEKMD